MNYPFARAQSHPQSDPMKSAISIVVLTTVSVMICPTANATWPDDLKSIWPASVCKADGNCNQPQTSSTQPPPAIIDRTDVASVHRVRYESSVHQQSYAVPSTELRHDGYPGTSMSGHTQVIGRPVSMAFVRPLGQPMQVRTAYFVRQHALPVTENRVRVYQTTSEACLSSASWPASNSMAHGPVQLHARQVRLVRRAIPLLGIRSCGGVRSR